LAGNPAGQSGGAPIGSPSHRWNPAAQRVWRLPWALLDTGCRHGDVRQLRSGLRRPPSLPV